MGDGGAGGTYFTAPSDQIEIPSTTVSTKREENKRRSRREELNFAKCVTRERCSRTFRRDGGDGATDFERGALPNLFNHLSDKERITEKVSE